ncbi:MAG: hypothetical protein SWE60_12355 [Thermodesulfobacteriota bacterium]|nr:hypothetical protein [Thermodesulfobacteriota bacterium]
MDPITTVASVATENHAANKRSAGTAHDHGSTAPKDQTEQAEPQAVGPSSGSGQDAQKGQETGTKKVEDGPDVQQNLEFIGETRDFGLENGKLLVRVYSSEGKLLRETPPGYLPPDRPRVNLKV